MGVIRTGFGRRLRARIALLGVLSLVANLGLVMLAIPASADPPVFTGGVSPTIFGLAADLNGSNTVTGADDSNAFYGDTHIIDGKLDCDNWTVANDGTAGSGSIGTDDDCTLVGFDGTADGVTIQVVNGSFATMDGAPIPDGTRLPTVFNAADPDNPDPVAADFAWFTISGKVDSNGNGVIDGDDCKFGIIGTLDDAGLGDPTDGADILGNPGANECGFATPPATADNGKVDLDSSVTITVADTCDFCFFGHQVENGLVQQIPPVTLELTPPTATNEQGTSHTVTAHLEDGDGDPVPGVTVFFDVTGANEASGSDVTDANGDATFTYTGANSGTDFITAFADLNDNAIDDGEPSDTATKFWEISPPPPAPPPAEAEELFAADGAGGNPATTLYTVNPDTGAKVDTKGPIGFAVTGLAFDPDTGVLYGSTGGADPNNPGHLIFIDPETGEGTLIGDQIPDCNNGAADITFTSDGTLYGWSECTDDLIVINKATGAGTVVGDSELSTFGSGLSADPDTDVLYLTPEGDTGDLYTVDAETGEATSVATLDGTEGFRINALAWTCDGETLYGNRNQGSEGSGPTDLITIEVPSGEITSKGLGDDQQDALAWRCPAEVPPDGPAPSPRIDVFSRGSAGQLLHWWFNEGFWSGPEDLGGVLASGTGPSAASWESGRLDVFVMGTDSQLYHRWFSGGAWSPGYENLGGVLAGSPDAVSWGVGRIDVFVRGNDNQMYHRWFTGGAWSGAYENLGGVLAGGPGAASWESGRLDVFVRGSDNALYHRWFTGGAWSPGYENLGGVVTADPDATSWDVGRIDAFVRGGDNALWHRWFTGGAWSGAYESLGGVLAGGPGSCSFEVARLDVFVRGTDNNLYHRWFTGGAWSGSYENLGGTLTGDPDCVSWDTGN
jgi:hypothetical protein